MPMLAFGYGRLSKPEKESGSISLDWQESVIRAYCKAHGLDLVSIFLDDGISAGKLLATRPAGGQLLEALGKQPCRLVVAKLDRLFRSGHDFYLNVTEWDRAGVELVSIAEGFDMGSIFGRAMAGILAVIAELERGLIQQRIQAGVKVRMDRGERVSRDATYGTRFIESGRTNAKGEPILVKVPDAQELANIRLMRSLRKRGASLREIAAELDSRGIKPRRGDKWAPSSLLNILKPRRRRDSAAVTGPGAVTVKASHSASCDRAASPSAAGDTSAAAELDGDQGGAGEREA